ncbi:MAG: alpha/beta fold hydrolase [Rhizobiales bacterium]|nr:alpha/beta fold hydrolase [Hyphomicrobiales bacterium]
MLIHGVGSALDAWDGVIAAMRPDRRYIRFDLRGHGRSAHTPGPYSLNDFVEDTIALLDHLDIAKADLVGFSLGGLIAQAIALDHPHRLNRLALISTIAGRTQDERETVRKRAETLKSEGAVTHLSVAVDRWFTDEFRKAHPDVLEARRKRSLENNPECYAAAYEVLAGNDLAGRLSEINVPTLVITGENDIGSNPRMARLIHDRIDGSELHILPLVKHAVLLESPVKIASLLENFLSSNRHHGDRRDS